MQNESNGVPPSTAVSVPPKVPRLSAHEATCEVVCEQLDKWGCCVVEGLVSTDLCDDIIRELEPHATQRKTYSEGGKVGLKGISQTVDKALIVDFKSLHLSVQQLVCDINSKPTMSAYTFQELGKGIFKLQSYLLQSASLENGLKVENHWSDTVVETELCYLQYHHLPRCPCSYKVKPPCNHQKEHVRGHCSCDYSGMDYLEATLTWHTI